MSISLVIGADGLIGSEIINILQSQGKAYLKTTRRTKEKKDRTLFLDLSEDISEWELPREVSVVYFCSYIGNIKQCREDPDFTRLVNVTNVITLIKRFINQGIYVLFPSTTQVFEGNISYQKSHDPTHPLTEYGKQKAQVEAELKQLPCNSIVRLSKVWGEAVPLFASWIQSLKEGEKISAFSDMYIAPLPVSFVADCLIGIAENKYEGIYHLSGNKDVSYYDIAQMIAVKLKVDSNLVTPGSIKDRGIPRMEAPYNTTLHTKDTYEMLHVNSPDVWETIFQICKL